MYLDAPPTNNALKTFLYRGGFCLRPTHWQPPPIDGWNQAAVGSYLVDHHPDTPVWIGSLQGLHVAIIGYAYDYRADLYDEAALGQRLLETGARRDRFLDLLDGMAGRYVVVRVQDDQAEVFHDAMGSRSVFFTTDAPMVASHAELLARWAGRLQRDAFIPFITSSSYRSRDVKYLPGLLSPYEGIEQLGPNTSVRLPLQKVERYWPRNPLEATLPVEAATEALRASLQGLATYLDLKPWPVFIGLTGGSDSRGIFAACQSLSSPPQLFTYVRSELGDREASLDARAAKQLAAEAGLHLNLIRIKNRPSLNEADTVFDHAFRRSSAYLRTNRIAWLESLAALNPDYQGMFVRGSGGEVLRGFYQTSRHPIRACHPNVLAIAYDVNAGTQVTREAFRRFIERTGFSEEAFAGRDPNDMFYLEHRMGVWGSAVLSEADLAIRSMPGYNDRHLFETFFRLSLQDRQSRESFEQVTQELGEAAVG